MLFVVMGAVMACTKQPIPLELRVLERAAQSGQAEPSLQFMVVSTEQQFAEVYRTIHAAAFQKPPPPVIDFDQHRVLVAFMGQKSTAGYEINFTSTAQQVDTTLDVTVQMQGVPENSMAAQIITSPYVLAVIEQGLYRHVRFVDEENQLLAVVEVP